MLVVHSSSHCDVCLDAYVWDEQSTLRAPHAIPCGHIFCRQCLENIDPSPNLRPCPLCRKPFNRERIKKLHMDPPENVHEHAENVLLQKMIVAWEDEQEMVAVIEEVETWLGTVDSPTLAQLKNAQAEFQRLKSRHGDDNRKIRGLQANLQRMSDRLLQDKNDGLAVEASLHSEIDSLNKQVEGYQAEVQSLRNQIARLEFSNTSSTSSTLPSNTHAPRRDKGKGRAVDQTFLPVTNNPLPAPPAIVSGDRYASHSGSGRNSAFDAEEVASAIEASLRDLPRRNDGYDSSGAGPSSAGSSRARDNPTPIYPRPIDPSSNNQPSGLVRPNGMTRSSSGGSTRSQRAQTPGIIGYSYRYMGTPDPGLGPRNHSSYVQQPQQIGGYVPSWVNGPTPPEPVNTPIRTRRTSNTEVPPVLNTAVVQAQQYASHASPSRRTRIVPGATTHERIAPATSAYPPPPPIFIPSAATFPTQSTTNGIPDTSMQTVQREEPRRKHRHKSHTRPRHEERAREGQEREAIPGVLGLGLIDENIEDRRPAAAYINGYMEGLGNGLEYGSTRAAPSTSSATRTRFTAGTEPRTAPASAAPPTTSNGNSSNTRPAAPRRSTVQNGATEVGAVEHLHRLMADPPRTQLPPVIENRSSIASSDAPTWGTPSDTSLSRRASTASDVLAGLNSFPAYDGQQRSSVSSDASLGNFPASGPLPSAPAIMSSGSSRRRTEGGNQSAAASRGISQTVPESERGAAPLRSLSYTNGPDSHSASTGGIYPSSATPTSSQPARRANDHQTSQAGRLDHHRHTSVQQFTTGNSHNSDRDQEARGRRPQPSRMATLPFPNSADTSNVNGLPHNPLPAAPAMLYSSSTSIASAPPLSSFRTGTASIGDRLVETPTPSSGDQGNALGLDLGNVGDELSYNRIPAFAAPTPRASHGLFLRSFSYESEGESGAQLYR